MFHSNPHHSVFGLSAGARFFHEEEGAGGGAAEAPATESTDTLAGFEPDSDGKPSAPVGGERVEGEKPPDFKTLGQKPVAEKPEGSQVPEKTEKPAGEAATKPATPAKATVKPAEAAKKPAEAAKPAETVKKPEAAAAKSPVEPVKAAEKDKPAAEAPKIPTDEEIDALQPKPGAPTHVIKHFGEMRAKMKEIAKAARTVQEQAQQTLKENETLKSATGKLPEEVEKELEGLRNFNLLFQAKNDPRFKAQFEAPIAKVEEGIYSFLAKNGLKPDVIEKIKSAASAAGGDIEAWPSWTELIDALKNPIDKQELIGALKSRRDAIAVREAHLSEIGASRDKFMEAVGRRDQEEAQKFAQGVEKASTAYTDNDWIVERGIPADATPEQKAAIEAENAKIKARADAFGEGVRNAYHRDPDKVAELAFKAVKADYLEEQNTSLTKRAEKAEARTKELEAQLAKIKNAGRMAHVETPTADTRRATTEDGKIGGDGSSALHDFFKRKSA